VITPEVTPKVNPTRNECLTKIRQHRIVRAARLCLIRMATPIPSSSRTKVPDDDEKPHSCFSLVTAVQIIVPAPRYTHKSGVQITTPALKESYGPSLGILISDNIYQIQPGIQTMPLAIVLINAEVGSEDELLRELRNLNNVSEAYAVYGVYDIVAKVEAETMKELKEVITSKVRKLKNLRSSLTMMVMEGT